MSYKITAAHATEDKLHKWGADASDLRWPPGHFPQTLETDLGNGLELFLVELDEDRAVYHQRFGCITLTVWND
jgi:hypothetical protein